MTKRRAILIAGMHRSGTSAMARVCNLLGVELGANILPPTAENERGYWEHAEAVRINDRLLDAFGLRWDTAGPLPSDWLDSSAARRARDQISQLIDEDFADCAYFAIKDPRISRVLPVWLDVLKLRGIRPFVLVMTRDWRAVARSLARRDGMVQEHARLLWLIHLSAAAHAARDYPHALISYEDLMRDWFAIVRSIERRMASPWPVSPEQATSDISEFLSADLSHFPLNTPQQKSDDASLNPAMQRALKLVTHASCPGIDADAESSLHIDVSSQLAFWGGYVLRLQELSVQASSMGKSRSALDARLLVDLLDIPKTPGHQNILTVFWRSSEGSYQEVASKQCSYEDEGSELVTCTVELPADAETEFIRIDPANSRGVFRIVSIVMDGSDVNEFGGQVRTVNGILLKERDGEVLRFLADHDDPHFELDLRANGDGTAKNSITTVKVSFCRDSLTSSLLDRMSRIEALMLMDHGND